MHPVDWVVLVLVLTVIVLYGVIKTKRKKTAESFLAGDKKLPWYTIGLSVMATQASAITFLSTPGQAFEDGMGFAQFYFGIPIAMVILSIFVLPIFYNSNVVTAYQYLENRFDLRTRTFAAILFLIQRGMGAGITIYAPSIILSTIVGWPLTTTMLIMGSLVILYTVLGGGEAVSVTQKHQMVIILAGMIVAGFIIFYQLPPNLEFGEAMHIAGALNKLEIVNFEFDLSKRYTLWTGLLGGVFLFLSYFGTDQSQVQRYLSGKSLRDSRLGLLFNGIFKVPMQFMVLFIGVLVFLFYQFVKPPIHFNENNVQSVQSSPYSSQWDQLQNQYDTLFEKKRNTLKKFSENEVNNISKPQLRLELNEIVTQNKLLSTKADSLILLANADANIQDSDYVFITFIVNFLPLGLVGLLIAVIFSAAMSSTSAEINALATTSMVDIYRRSLYPNQSEAQYLSISKWLIAIWGAIALGFAYYASLFDNLIEAVNILGSLFYGVMLGIFTIAFFLKKIDGQSTFWAAILSQILVFALFALNHFAYINLAYLWLNLIGCLQVIFIALIIQSVKIIHMTSKI